MVDGRQGRPLLWHRIALRRGAGRVNLHVPTYSHVLAYGPGRPGKARPDVIDQGRMLWAHGIGVDLARYIASWLAEQGVKSVLDPFAVPARCSLRRMRREWLLMGRKYTLLVQPRPEYWRFPGAEGQKSQVGGVVRLAGKGWSLAGGAPM